MHPLSFRVMRLCKPSLLAAEAPIRVSLPDDLASPGVQPLSAPHDTTTGPFTRRTLLNSPVEALGLDGTLLLPQSFGTIYLGENFCSFISVGNHTNTAVKDVACKVELKTETRTVTLFSTEPPLPSLGPGQRHDFIVRQDIKEVGPHTLACSVTYTSPADGERKFLPQYFKFASQNPISVRTKIRTVNEAMLLEACIENMTKGPLVLDHIKFDAGPGLSAEPVLPLPDASGIDLLEEYIQGLQVIGTGGGALNVVFCLARTSEGRQAVAATALGKLEIQWQGTLGETGRLQTQQITETGQPQKDVRLQLVEAPAEVAVEASFIVRVAAVNQTDTRLPRLTIASTPSTTLPPAGAGSDVDSVLALGRSKVQLEEIAPWGRAEAELRFVACEPGLLTLNMVLTDDREQSTLDRLAFGVYAR